MVWARCCLARAAIALTFCVALHAADAASGQFSPAAFAPEGAGSGLIVFPSAGKEFSVPFQALMLQWVVYGAGGRTLYATAFRQLDAKTVTPMPGMLKIDLNPVHVGSIAGLEPFDGIDRFAISRGEDMVVFGAGRQDDAGNRTYGIYQLSLPSGHLRTVLEVADSHKGWPWRVLDLSPAGTEALILENRRLALLDLAHGTITSLPGQLWGGAYSPDGKWIAALELGAPDAVSKMILFDVKDFNHRVDLGASDDPSIAWSPDSKLILQCTYRPACPSRNPLALEMVDVETGKRTLIKRSICNASREIGWVRSDIGK